MIKSLLNFEYYKIISILFLFLYVPLGAQKYTIRKIDSLQKYEAKKLHDIGNLEAKILLEKKLIKESQRLKYDEGVARGFIQLVLTI